MLGFPPFSAFFASLLALNIETFLTSTSLFLHGHFLSIADNYQFLKGMKNFVEKSGHKLKICHEYMNRGDRWIQVKRMRVCFRIKLNMYGSLNLTGTLNPFLIKTKRKQNVLQMFYLRQDELEFGYIEAPHQRFPVVLDSPRDGKLQDFPYKELLVRDKAALELSISQWLGRVVSCATCAVLQHLCRFWHQALEVLHQPG